MNRAALAVLALGLVGLVSCSNESDSSVASTTTERPLPTRTSASSEPSPAAPEPPLSSELDAVEGAAIEIYHPSSSAEVGPTVLVFGDSEADASRYRSLAEGIAERGDATVGVVTAALDTAPLATACAASTLYRNGGGESSVLVAIGFGDGAALAAGEAFDGPWTSWSASSLCGGDEAPTPISLIAVGGDFSVYPPRDRLNEGLSPFDQIGGNPYLEVTIVTEGREGTVRRWDEFHDELAASSYDVRLVRLPSTDIQLEALGGESAALEAELVEVVLDIVLGTAAFL